MSTKEKRNVSEAGAMNFRSHERIIMSYLTNFYTEHKDVVEKKMVPIVEEGYPISLRFIETFITKYCKENRIIISNKKSNNFIVYENYKEQLRSYDKQHFDPFKRKHHVLFNYKKGRFIHTTVGQLNFFRWIEENEILDYIINNIDEIRKNIKNFKANKRLY